MRKQGPYISGQTALLPVVVKDGVPDRLLEAALVDGAHAGEVIDAQLVWADADNRAKPVMGTVQSLVLPMGETDPENPEAREASRPVSSGDPGEG